LEGCDPDVELLGQDAESTYCAVCYCEPLGAAPAIRLECGHIIHHECGENLLKARWNGPVISFSFMGCPLCKKKISHLSLEELTSPLNSLSEKVTRKALTRLEAEGLNDAPEIKNKGERFFDDPEGYALHKFNYYLCSKCDGPYFGGLRACGAGVPDNFDPSELVCGSCIGGGKECTKHDKALLSAVINAVVNLPPTCTTVVG